jgi:DNA-3-methyladenine glycosylase I
MIAYHDTEWGVPVRDDTRLFETLVLGGAQAGLSWRTILGRREGYREAFDGFDPERVAAYGPERVEALLQDTGIIRNRLKVNSAITNARAVLALRDEGTTLSDFLWDIVGGEPVVNRWRTLDELPASTPLSDRMSRALKRRGFSFVGTTICYAFMQAVGMVNDHTVDCFRHRELTGG